VDFFNQLSFINSRCAYSHVILSNRTHTTIWFKYDHFGFSYLTHFLTPIYILNFKPFKTTLEKTKGWGYGIKNHIEPNKIILTRWVNKALNQSLTNITSSNQG